MHTEPRPGSPRLAPGYPQPFPAHLQPEGRAGTVQQRVDRRRPNDRRQYESPVMLDIRGKHERRRRPLPPGMQLLERRSYPEPPLGIDEWA